MRSEILRTYKTVHTWTGIIAGLALFIAFYAGSLTMFKDPITRWAAPPPAVVAASPLEHAHMLVARTLAQHPEAGADFTLSLGRDPHQAPSITWQRRTGDTTPWIATLDNAHDLVVRPLSARSDLAAFIDHVHRTAGLPGDEELGAGVMGVISAVYALALLSGVIVLMPTLLKDFFALRLGANLKRMWLDAHNVIGITSLPFHIVMALSAMVFGLHDVIYDAQDVAVYEGGFEQQVKQGAPFLSARLDARPAAMLTPQALLDRLQEQAPGFAPHTLRYRAAGTAGANIWVTGDDPCCMLRSATGAQTLVSATTGEILNGAFLPGHQTAWTSTIATFFSLHFGTFGGTPVRWGYFLLGLAGAFLFYSGNLLWIESRRRRQQRGGTCGEQRRAVRWMSAATVGVCLGCIAGLSLMIASAKWLSGQPVDLNLAHRLVYYATFLTCIVWALGRGAARAGVELAWLAALATCLIPLTSVLGWLMPPTGWWTSASISTVGVDIIALLGAAGLGMMAKSASRRARLGPKDSVWSGQA